MLSALRIFLQSYKTCNKNHLISNWGIYLIAIISIMGCFIPIKVALGIEFTLAPLIYLFALRIWGRNIALISALITMMPTLWWWDHSYALIGSLCQVLMIDYLVKRFRFSITFATGIFYASLGLFINALIFFLIMEMPLALTIILFSKKAINDLVLAACVDLLAVFWGKSPYFPYIKKKKSISLRMLTGTALTTAIFMISFALYASQSRYYVNNLGKYPFEVEMATHKWILKNEHINGPYQKIVMESEPGDKSDIFIFKGNVAALEELIKQRMGCTSIASARTPEYGLYIWNNICLENQIDTSRGQYNYVYSPRQPLLLTLRKLVEQIFILLGLMMIALVMRNYIVKLISQSIHSWDITLRQFGTEARKPDLPIPLREFIDPISKFIRTNNSYVEIKKKQEQIETSIRELQTALDLHFISDIIWYGDNNSLHFQQLDTIKGQIAMVLRLHPVDQAEFSSNLDKNETVVEFRTKDGETNSWYIIILKDHISRGAWKNGLIMKLKASRLITENLAHQSRLVELGSMASAISHELKQPLFTIALAAENALYWLQQDKQNGQEKALSKIEKIITQVERAKDIIERMTCYARSSNSRTDTINIIETMQSVARFMRPIFVHNNIKIEFRYIKNDILNVDMSRIALEQIVSNVLQNAVDAILERQKSDNEEGRIIISLEKSSDHRIILTINDNGIGLNQASEESAFDAFYTTKAPGQGTGLGLFICRQFVEEAGGKLYLSANVFSQGANLRIELPESKSSVDDMRYSL